MHDFYKIQNYWILIALGVSYNKLIMKKLFFE